MKRSEDSLKMNKKDRRKSRRRQRIMLVVGIIFVLLGGVLIYWNISYSPYKARFVRKMKERVKTTTAASQVCTADEIAQLPEALQKFCTYIGLEGSPKYQAVRTRFNKSNFVFDASTGKIMKMDYDLWLFFDQPYRSAYCAATMFGVPFDGIDYCTDDKQGGMKGILGKAIQIFDVRAQQGYQAGLISWLAEGVTLNPSVLLSDYVTYEQIDDLHVKATVSYQGVSGSGIFTLNEEGVITEFYSDERQVEKIDGVDTFVGWRCEYENYSEEGQMRRAHLVRSTKVFPDREVVYFESDDFNIDIMK